MACRNVYAVYKGDEFLDIGTVKELAKKLNVKIRTIYYWSSPANKKRIKKKGKLAIKIEED